MLVKSQTRTGANLGDRDDYDSQIVSIPCDILGGDS